MIVIEKGLRAPHNLEVYHNNGKYLIDFDIEYAGGKTFVEAHDLAASIEDEIKQTIPAVDKVTIHMEEHPPDENEIRNETEAALDLREEIRETILADDRILQCSDLTLLQAGNLYNLSITCLFAKTLTLDEVHRIIGEMENRLHATFRMLRRITVHAEPM
jgi:divalent metal cation (Fe/Co/Zn/Cd) transporter